MRKFFLIFLFPLLLSNKTYTPKSFSLKIYGKNQSVTLANNSGKKTLINFWASWCTSCVEEIPILHGLKNDPKAKNYRFLAISAGDSKKKIKKFIKRYKFNYTILMDKSRNISKSWGVDALPVTIILDKLGKVIYADIRPPKTLP